MEIVRSLCKIQHLSKLGKLLESYVSQSDAVPKGAYRRFERRVLADQRPFRAERDFVADSLHQRIAGASSRG